MKDSQRRAMFAKMRRRAPSSARLKALIADERAASKEYKKYGYTRLSHDEARHRVFLIKLRNAKQSYRDELRREKCSLTKT